MNPKLAAAVEAIKLVRDGQVIGLGSGTTAELAIGELAKRIDEEGLRVIGIPTSEGSRRTAEGFGIPLSTLDEHDAVDLTIDGADEVDPRLNLIKGLGGALLREKMVAHASEREVIVVDGSKLVSQLGIKAPLPVEVVSFSVGFLSRRLAELNCRPTLRKIGTGPYVTDNGNRILDCRFEEGIRDPWELERMIGSIPGVVESGLFLDIADEVIVGETAGVRTIRRE